MTQPFTFKSWPPSTENKFKKIPGTYYSFVNFQTNALRRHKSDCPHNFVKQRVCCNDQFFPRGDSLLGDYGHKNNNNAEKDVNVRSHTLTALTLKDHNMKIPFTNLAEVVGI